MRSCRQPCPDERSHGGVGAGYGGGWEVRTPRWIREWWQRNWLDACLPCSTYREKSGGNLACVCGWNISAHPRSEIVRVLGEAAAADKDAWLREGGE